MKNIDDGVGGGSGGNSRGGCDCGCVNDCSTEHTGQCGLLIYEGNVICI